MGSGCPTHTQGSEELDDCLALSRGPAPNQAPQWLTQLPGLMGLGWGWWIALGAERTEVPVLSFQDPISCLAVVQEPAGPLHAAVGPLWGPCLPRRVSRKRLQQRHCRYNLLTAWGPLCAHIRRPPSRSRRGARAVLGLSVCCPPPGPVTRFQGWFPAGSRSFSRLRCS